MHFLFVHQDVLVCRHPVNNKVFLADERGFKFEHSDGSLINSEYQESIYIATVAYHSSVVEIYFPVDYLQSRPINELIDEGMIEFRSEGKIIDLDTVTQYALFFSVLYTFDNRYLVFGYLDKSGDETKYFTVVYDFKAHTHYQQLVDLFNTPSVYLEGDLYNTDLFEPSISRFSNDFELLWTANKQDRKGEIVSPRTVSNEQLFTTVCRADSLIVNVSARRIDRPKAEGERKEPFFVDGELVCLDKSDGSEKWQCTFPVQIDDFVAINDDQLAVASERFLYIVNSNTGDIEQKNDTRIRTSEREECTSITLLVKESLLFVFAFKECQLQIWDCSSMQKLRTIDAADKGWQFVRTRPQVLGDQIFVPVQIANDPIGPGGLFVIDANDIYAEVSSEQVPEFTRTIPHKGAPGGIEFVFEATDSLVALRFFERSALSAVLISSGVDNREYFTPRTVKLRLKGCRVKREEINRQMSIFKERFELLVQEPHIPGIFIPSVEFEYELLD